MTTTWIQGGRSARPPTPATAVGSQDTVVIVPDRMCAQVG